MFASFSHLAGSQQLVFGKGSGSRRQGPGFFLGFEI